MWAKESVVGDMVEVGLCDDCPLNKLLHPDERNPLFVSIQGASESGRGREIYFTDGRVIQGEVVLPNKRPENVKNAFQNCQEAIKNGRVDAGKISCGALAELQRR